MKKVFFSQKRIVLIMVLLLIMISCSRKYNRLEFAIEFAGKNKNELIEVLEYYKNDKLKYQAACFLIENMPQWYSYEGWQLDSLEVLMKKDRQNNLSEKEKKAWIGFDYHTLNKVYDAQVITSKYLIENIELAFKEWKNRPWNKTLPFKDFCELILPYRIGNEKLSNWRSLYNSYYGNILDSIYEGNDVLEACKIINDELNRQSYKYSVEWKVPHLSADFLFNTRIGYCREISDLIQYAMRSCGIPVAADFMLYSPDYRYSHEWNVVRDTTGKYLQFGFDNLNPIRNNTQNDGRKKGKVYRHCYALQEERNVIYKYAGWNIGETKSKYWKDVTSEYFGSNEALVRLYDVDNQCIGLSVFSTHGWQIIGEGIHKGKNKVSFKDIEPSIIYMPVSVGIEIHAAGYPFMIDKKGQVKEFIPDTTCLEEVLLNRKMALIPRIAAWGYSQIGARLEGDNNKKFTHPQFIAEVKDTMNYTYQILKSNCSKPVRYIRYIPPFKLLQIAELKLYEDSSCQKEVKMKPITDIPNIVNVIDGDILSYLYKTSKDTIQPLIFDFGSPKQINSIYYIPRTDDNYVWKGDVYELLYNDGPNGWKSLGEKIATSKNIKFKAPQNALLWLRNKTKGTEEQVFIYKKNRQFFNSDF